MQFFICLLMKFLVFAKYYLFGFHKLNVISQKAED